MIQLNEETSNRRPITLWLKSIKKDESNDKNGAKSTEDYVNSIQSGLLSPSGKFQPDQVVDLTKTADGESGSVNDRWQKYCEGDSTSRVIILKGLNGQQIEELVKYVFIVSLETESLKCCQWGSHIPV